MDSVAILLGLAIAALVAAYGAQPLMGKTGRRRSEGGGRQSEVESRKAALESEYRAALEAIRDLDFDFQTGKVLEQDYGPLREKYAAQGAALLQELDQMGGAAEPAARARRKQRRAAISASGDIEAMIQSRRKRASLGQTCPACGQPCSPEDRFCGKCGAALEARV